MNVTCENHPSLCMQISKEDKLEQMERLLHSRTLHGSDSLIAFLRFVVEKSVLGQEQQLKEYTIATEVFGRGKDFDSRLDSLVRVQASRLRAKLREYYQTEGRQDSLVIDLPKGKYTPLFSPAVAEHENVGNGASALSSAAEFRKDAYWQEVTPVWGNLLQANQPILIVFSTTIFYGSYETGMKLYNSLDVMEHAQQPELLAQNPLGNGESNLPRIDHYTGIGELLGVYFLSEFFARVQQPFRLKRSLSLTWDETKAENIVVLGSPAENLFLLDLPTRQDFQFRWVKDEHGRSVNAIVNTNPQPGEQEMYVAKQFGPSPSQISEDYAVVSLLQGLTDKTRLLILAGINTFGTQAAAEYVTRPECIEALISHLNIAPEDQPPRLPAYYQVLLRVKVNGGVPVQISYVTHHVLNPQRDQ